MKVAVRFFTVLREITGKREVEIETPDVINIQDVLNYLSKLYGSRFVDYVFDEKGSPRSYLQFLVNGRSATSLQGFETKLKDGDRVAIIPPVGGG